MKFKNEVKPLMDSTWKKVNLDWIHVPMGKYSMLIMVCKLR